MDLSKAIIIDDDNWRDHIGIQHDDGSVVLPDDHPNNGGERRFMGCLPRITTPGKLWYAAKPDFKLIPRNEWYSRIKDREQSGATTRALQQRYGKKVKDQNGTNYCHANSLTNAIENARIRQGEGYIELSAGSIGGPVTNYRNQGAWIDADLEIGVQRGAASVEFVPPNQVSKSGWKPGAVENALKHRITDWWDLMNKSDGQMDDRIMTLLLLGEDVPVGLDWWSHSVLYVDPYAFGPNDFGYVFENSWGNSYGDQGYGILRLGKGTPDAAYATRQATANLG